ncbi:MAG: M28 family metallopeptidase [Solirubrobacterales bacterium]
MTDEPSITAAQGRERYRGKGGEAMQWVRLLADEIGPRRPTGPAERLAAERVRDELGSEGLAAQLEEFRGLSTFAAPVGAVVGMALAAGALPRRRWLARSLLAAAAGAHLIVEGGLVRTPVTDVLSRRRSQNLVATIEPAEDAERTICLLCHLDTSRSGLLFHPSLIGHLTPWLKAQSAAVLVQSAEPLLGRSRSGRLALAGCRALLATAAALLLERELRGEDVPGANDNASGVAVVAQLALELLADRPRRSRIVVLMTGCEEAGMLGAQAFLRSRDTSGWLFLNFDNVGGAAPLHYLPQEGIVQKWDADSALASIAAAIARDRPELGLRAAERPIGLTYDATPVMARGGRAITFVAADDGVIPNYHWPTDTTENVDPGALERGLEVGRLLVGAIDRGEAD